MSRVTPDIHRFLQRAMKTIKKSLVSGSQRPERQFNLDQLRKDPTSSKKPEAKPAPAPVPAAAATPPPPPPNSAKPLPQPATSSSAPQSANRLAQPQQLQPPIVVVSSDGPDLARTSRESLAESARNPAINRLRPGPKDTIPLKPPRKQRSSRFVVTDKVEIERLPPFMG